MVVSRARVWTERLGQASVVITLDTHSHAIPDMLRQDGLRAVSPPAGWTPSGYSAIVSSVLVRFEFQNGGFHP